MSGFKDDVLSDFSHIWLSAKFELLKHHKRKRLFMTGAMAILLPLLFYAVPLATGMDFAATADAFASGNLAFITMMIVISAAIFAGDAISGEAEKRTNLVLYSAPHRKIAVLVGKYLGSAIATLSVVSLYYLVTAAEISAVYGVSEISANYMKSFLVSVLYSLAVVSLIYFFSSILKRAIVSTLLGFFSLMMVLPIVSSVLSMVDIDPWFIVTHAASLISDVFGLSSGGGFGPSDGDGPMSGFGFSVDFVVGVSVMAGYAIFFFLAGLAVASRKGVEG